VNFTLNQANREIPKRGTLSHLGVQLQDTGQLEVITAHMRENQLLRKVETNTSCCYALQDKIWIDDPDGNSLEFFVVIDPDTYDRNDPALKGTCCGTGAAQ